MGSIVFYSDFHPGVSDLVDDRVLSLLSNTRFKIAYIPSESDVTRRYFRKVQNHYNRIGIDSVYYFDLGDEYEKENLPELMASDAIHLSGGDPEAFLATLQRREFKKHIENFLDQGKLVIGVSAGAMVLTNSVGLISLDERILGQNSRRKKALGLVDFEFYPHFEDETSLLSNLSDYAKSNKTVVYACDDGGGLEISGCRVTAIGSVTKFEVSGQCTSL